jgi:hypothetical protein
MTDAQWHAVLRHRKTARRSMALDLPPDRIYQAALFLSRTEERGAS